MRRSLLALMSGALLMACATSDGHHEPDGGLPVDSDGDHIADVDEGSADFVDTDRDGTFDYLDADSDGDGLTDSIEAGDEDLTTAPADSDHDRIADFRDLDSDGNGRSDDVDGTADLDGDRRRDFADDDDDGDLIGDLMEIGGDAAHPVDTDSDQTPDFRDADSDGDTVADRDEGSDNLDGDPLPNYRDLDSDGDCRPDRVEAGGAPPIDTDGDRRPDFVDRDSDADGVPDQEEDTNCNGVRDADERDARDTDSDDDGAPDLVEKAAKTDPLDPAKNPQADGNFVFIVPYQEAPSPADDDLDFQTKLNKVDLYVMLDRSGSMKDEIVSVKQKLNEVVASLVCPAGPPRADCVPDLWAGAGAIGYQQSASYAHLADLARSPDLSMLPDTPVPEVVNSKETTVFAMWAAITGNGSMGAPQCSGADAIEKDHPVAARGTCTGSPADAGKYDTFGYPCFRDGALPVILLATDEPPLDEVPDHPHGANKYSMECPDWETTVLPALTARGAKVVGVLGSDPQKCDDGSACTVDELKRIARDTGAIDSDTNLELVFNGATSNAANAIKDGVKTLAKGLPLDLSAHAINGGNNGTVDAVASFIDHLETLQSGVGNCSNGLIDRDTNNDQHADQFVRVKNGVPVCWKLVARKNVTVLPGADQPQLYRARVEVRGDGIAVLDARTVFFVVPPRNIDPPVD